MEKIGRVHIGEAKAVKPLCIVFGREIDTNGVIVFSVEDDSALYEIPRATFGFATSARAPIRYIAQP